MQLAPGYEVFARIVSEINALTGKMTTNSLKKNVFPDLDRMGLIVRCDKDGVPIMGRRPVATARLSSAGGAFANSVKLIERYDIFTKAVDKLFSNKISELAELVYYSDFRTDKISIYELMLILSDEDDSVDKIALLKAYRSLPKVNRGKAIELIKDYADPASFHGNKTEKRDFSNWKNEAQQILGLLSTTIYFEADNKGFKLRTGQLGVFEAAPLRSQTAKANYFRVHGLERRSSFELHHVIPFRAARNKTEFKLVDDHRNLLYVHKLKHKEIGESNEAHVILYAVDDGLELSDFDQEIIRIGAGEALFAMSQVPLMVGYNRALLHSIYERRDANAPD